jgi:hypothetical protein
MSYLSPRFENDIFLSYARVDNLAPRSQDDRWVDSFRRSLETELSRLIGRLGVIKIWMDTRELASNQYFDDEIKRQIASSGIFLALTSPGYLHPECYCRKELAEFFLKAQQPPESLRVGTRSRLVTALLYNIHQSEWPTEYAGLTSAQLFDTSQTDSGDPTRIRSDLFEDQVKKLARETCDLLEEYKASFAASAPTPPPVKKTRVFLADTVESLSELRSCVTNALNKEGIEIFQRMPPPYDVDGHDRTAKERIAASDLSVHLFDATPGEKFIEADSGTTFLQRQAELGLQSPKPQFLWVPPKSLVDIPLIQDQGYRDFLAGLENGKRDKNSYTFQRDPVNAVPEEIIKRIKELQKPVTQSIASSALLETHRKDQLHALDLYPLLLQKALQPYINPDDDDPGENVGTFQRLVSQITVLIIIFGSVASDWVQERLISSLQLAATLEPRRLKLCGIYAPQGAESSNHQINLGPFPGTIPVFVFNDRETLGQLLDLVLR